MISFSSWLMKFPRCLSSLHMILSLTRLGVLMDSYSLSFFEVFLFLIHILLWKFIQLRPFRRGRKSYSVIQKLCRYSLKVLRLYYALDWALVGIYRHNSWQWGLQILGFSQKSLTCTCLHRYSCKRRYTKLQFKVQWRHAWATQRLIFIAFKFPWVFRAGDFNR